MNFTTSKKKWALCGTRGVPGAYGGFETFCEQFCKENYRSRDPMDVLVFCDGSIDKTSPFHHAKRFFIPISANGVSGIIYDCLSMLLCIVWRRNVVLLGCSGGMAIPFCRLFGIEVITNVAGIEWGRSKWGIIARSMLKFSEYLSVRFSNHIVADNQGIFDYISDAYGTSASIIEYGADHVIKKESGEERCQEDYYFGLARCQPDNHVEEILKVFSGNSEHLIFISNWDSCDYGKSLKDKYSNQENLTLMDPVFDLSVLFGFRTRCKAYVHGHSAGGTNPALIEAMICGALCICFDNKFNRFTTSDHGYFWKSMDDLGAVIDNFSAEEADVIRKKSANVAVLKYQWKVIVSKYRNLMDK